MPASRVSSTTDAPSPDAPSPGPAPIAGARSGRVGAARRLKRPAARREQGRFLVEGVQAVGAALAVGELLEVFVGVSATPRHEELLRAVRVPVRVVTDEAVASLSETVTPQGLVAVAALPAHRLADLHAPRLVAVCIGAGDPGNAGTVIRSADAAGADAVVFTGSGVDPFGGKCVRSSAGSHFHLPVIVEPALAGVLDRLRARGCRIVATSGAADRDIDTAVAAGELDGPTAWLFGNEAHGLASATLAAADAVLRVPVYGQAESLNLAVASALCLYASARAQRTGRSGTDGTGGGGRR
ncbi:rRNA methylase [Frankia casuarinae]|uniref:tRNA/rRNA methyltransferase n=2 Tax=Frankia casuarinae (strain DSM 45818 / CECT 9043 / HFP020203 / CcI3) TaxID=106370 RepID=Q2J856_FRACC|nr:tRNA/rRNA methyltransferase [Frankia casuarinae]ETA01081.1 rRNA methylase [Frankia sp. CcI6]KDA42115.1 rRNA methylase [Frankia sp. BMG5.23]KEZ35506.1 rRNA methylase [Frankia sp. CeD]KFB03674.1 rRNA methylase [Frankia sp. Allo2]